MERCTSYANGSILTGANATLERLKVAVMTFLGEFSPDPSIGVGLLEYIDEKCTTDTLNAVKSLILSFIKNQFPQMTVQKIILTIPQSGQIDIELDINVSGVNKNTSITLQ